MQIITGKTGSPHVSAEHDRAKHAGTYGTGEYVLNVGSKFAATVEPSTNTIRIADGDGMMQGTHFRIPHGDYDDVYIDNGTTGYIRKDLIVARYTRSGDIEDVQLAVIKGEPSASDPQTPECTQGDILNGEALAEMPLYEVTIDCTVAEQVTITVSEPLFSTTITIDEVFNKIYPVGSIYMSVNSVNPSALFGGTWVSWGAGRVPVGVNASDDEFSTVEKEGGEKTHTLTVDEMPSHKHFGSDNVVTSVNETSISFANGSGSTVSAVDNVIDTTTSNYLIGSSKAHNNLQPYITCYMWKRTA